MTAETAPLDNSSLTDIAATTTIKTLEVDPDAIKSKTKSSKATPKGDSEAKIIETEEIQQVDTDMEKKRHRIPQSDHIFSTCASLPRASNIAWLVPAIDFFFAAAKSLLARSWAATQSKPSTESGTGTIGR